MRLRSIEGVRQEREGWGSLFLRVLSYRREKVVERRRKEVCGESKTTKKLERQCLIIILKGVLFNIDSVLRNKV